MKGYTSLPFDEECIFAVGYIGGFLQYCASLGDDLQSNWLTEYAPDVLLYAALLEATPFLKNDERVPMWTGMYDRAAQALNGEDLSKIMDRSANRSEA